MSFRSLSVLPKCLHGRQASSRILPLRPCAQCQKYLHSLVPVSAPRSGRHASHHPRDPESARTRASPLKFLQAQQINADAAPPLEHCTHIEELTDLPPLPRDPRHSNALPRRSTEERPRLSTRNTKFQKPTAEEWKEWHHLHDNFLEVRRKRPDQTEEIFKTQKMLARQFLGDAVSPEMSATMFKTKWSALSSEDKIRLLPSLLIGSLVESAAHSLLLLDHVKWIPQSFLTRMNCLRHISLMYWKDLQQNPGLKRTYQALIEQLRSPDTWPKQKLPAVLLQNLLFWSTPKQCRTIIENFGARYPDADASSVVAIADHYLRHGEREEAFECLRGMPESMLRQPDDAVKSLRDRLLRLDVVAKGEAGTNFKYLPQLLALGIPPDEELHNAVIESAIANGMPDVAWDLYQYLETSKFRSNARSHLVLLRDGFQRSDMQRVNEVMTAIHLREDLVRDQYLMAYSMNVVRNISYYDKKLAPEEALSHILALYDRAYNRNLLARLGLVRATDDESVLPDPSPTLLAFTVWTCILIKRRSTDVLRLWEWIKYLIADGDARMIEAAKFDIVYNGLILFHARQAATLPRALEVMQYMLSNKLCLPTSRTWSILLCAYLKYNQVAQAEMVLALMQRKGFKVQEIDELYGSHVPSGYDLSTLADQAAAKLDERSMPEEMGEWLAAASSSLAHDTRGSASADHVQHLTRASTR